MKFYIIEKESIATMREGRWIDATNLTSAKRAASRGKIFQGTVLTISEYDNSMIPGLRLLSAYKEEGEPWCDVHPSVAFPDDDEDWNDDDDEY